MKQVSKIKCMNNGGFLQKFRVKWNGGESGWTDTYPNPQSKTVELKDFDIKDFAEVWIEVKAIAGKTVASPEHVIYNPSSEDSVLYRTTGTTLNFHVELMS